MGAPKQKWTAEEEAALKAGIDKHGTGKWRTILKDPEFSHILYLRSNVDLKDKWRNMGVATNGLGSHERAKAPRKRSTPAYKHGDDDFSSSPVEEDFDDEPADSRPVSCSYKKMQITGPKKSSLSLENLVVEAITNLNEPAGSSMMAIAMYIEEHYWSPQDFESMLSMKLKMMAGSGKIVKVKRKYRIAPTLGFSEQRGSMMLPLERKQKFFSSVERGDLSTPVRSQIDAEIARMRNMTSLEAAAAAARAMAEAEVAMAEAEEAAREAEIAEADAEEAQAFAEAAFLTLKNRSTGKLVRPTLKQKFQFLWWLYALHEAYMHAFTCFLYEDTELLLTIFFRWLKFSRNSRPMSLFHASLKNYHIHGVGSASFLFHLPFKTKTKMTYQNH